MRPHKCESQCYREMHEKQFLINFRTTDAARSRNEAQKFPLEKQTVAKSAAFSDAHFVCDFVWQTKWKEKETFQIHYFLAVKNPFHQIENEV